MKSTDRFGLAILCVGLLACSNEPAPGAELSSSSPTPAAAPAHAEFAITTDSLVYYLEPSTVGLGAVIAYSYTNRTDKLVSLINCNGAYGVRLEKLEGAEWVNAWAPGMNACLSAPIQLASGESRRDSLEINGVEGGPNVY